MFSTTAAKVLTQVDLIGQRTDGEENEYTLLVPAVDETIAKAKARLWSVLSPPIKVSARIDSIEVAEKGIAFKKYRVVLRTKVVGT